MHRPPPPRRSSNSPWARYADSMTSTQSRGRWSAADRAGRGCRSSICGHHSFRPAGSSARSSGRISPSSCCRISRGLHTKTTISAERFQYTRSRYADGRPNTGLLDDAGLPTSLITGFDERSACGVTFVTMPRWRRRGRYQIGSYPSPGAADILAGDSAVDSSSAGWSRSTVFWS